MLQEATEKRRPGRKSSQQNYLIPRRRLFAPSRLPKAYPTDFAQGSYALAPWAQAEYPGISKIVWTVLQGRASPHTIRDWRRGKRKAPLWARELLREAIEKRLAELEHARALLA